MPKLAANCLITDCATSRPALAENLFSTVVADPLLFAAITGDKDAHSEYIFNGFQFNFNWSSDLMFSLA